MHPVVSLGEDDRVGAVGHLVGQFLAAVRGQAVQHDDILVGFADQFGIHLVGREDLEAFLGLFFLAHRDPGVGVDDLRTLDGFMRVADLLDDGAGFRRETPRRS